MRAFCCGFLVCWRKTAAEYNSIAMAVQEIHGRERKPLHRTNSVSVKGLNCCHELTHQQQVRVSTEAAEEVAEALGGMQDPGKGGAWCVGAQPRRLARLPGPGTSAAERAGSWVTRAPSPRGVSTLSLRAGEATTGLCGQGRARASHSFHPSPFS